MLTPTFTLILLAAYFAVLIALSFLNGKTKNDEEFFTAGRSAKWYLVAFGMIGASLSGVTFISVPGWVKGTQFSYLVMVGGYLLGYAVIATVLMPLFYRLNLVTIYSYLGDRLGRYSHRTASVIFFVSRLLGSALRLYLAALVLHTFIFAEWGIPFDATVFITILFIWLYTFRGGIKTIIWTDTFQTFFMLAALVATIFLVSDALSIRLNELPSFIFEHEYSKIIFTDFGDKKHFFKQFVGGAFTALSMTGLDQDMMQKNLTCRNIKEAQKNMFWFSLILIPVNLLFLSLGVLLYVFAEKNGISAAGDELFPNIAKNHLGTVGATLFFLGVIAAAYSSADSAMTALTTSVCYDFIGFERSRFSEKEKKHIRTGVHIGVSVLMFSVILITGKAENKSVIDLVFKAAGYTYGPLLGLFAFAILTKRKAFDALSPFAALTAPLMTLILDLNGKEWFNYAFGYELLPLNGFLSFMLLYFFSLLSRK
jgi:Na+/proline symporter